MGIHFSSDNSLHHGKVFKIVMCLEQGVSSEELNKYTANTPDITREGPAKTKDDLWCSVVSSRDN